MTGMPDAAELLSAGGAGLGGWAYAIVAALAYLETAALVGLLVPGELAVITGGALAATGAIDLAVLIAVVWTSAVAGDATGFATGRRLARAAAGRRLLAARPQATQRIRSLIERRGELVVVAGRFAGAVRPLVPPVAGSVGMPAGRFLAADITGAGLWAAACCLAGYAFGSNLDRLLALLHDAQVAAAAACLAALAGWVVWRLRRRTARTARTR